MISIITPVFNRSDLTAQFLFYNEIHYPHDQGMEWIIIDNGSTDGTGGILEYWKDIIGPRLVVLNNDENKGFPTACNQGAERAQGGTLLFLNNDVLIKGDYISPLENVLKDDPLCLVGAQKIVGDTGWNNFNGQVIPYLAGWCVAVDSIIFSDLGGFDERYSPAYYEDIDLCYNALKEGLELKEVFVPLQHIGEQTGLSQFKAEDRKNITLANKARFAEKWGLSL